MTFKNNTKTALDMIMFQKALLAETARLLMEKK